MEKNNATEQPKEAKKKYKVETKKLLVYLSFVLIFLLVMWFILAPKDKGSGESDTLNTLVPESTNVEIEDDKAELYATEDQVKATEEKDSVIAAQVASTSVAPAGMIGDTQAPQAFQEEEDRYGFNYKPDESAYLTSDLYTQSIPRCRHFIRLIFHRVESKITILRQPLNHQAVCHWCIQRRDHIKSRWVKLNLRHGRIRFGEIHRLFLWTISLCQLIVNLFLSAVCLK